MTRKIGSDLMTRFYRLDGKQAYQVLTLLVGITEANSDFPIEDAFEWAISVVEAK